MIRFLKSNWFLFVLLAVVAVGFASWKQTAFLSRQPVLTDGLVMVVLFLMALPLPTAKLVATIRQPGPSILASTINYLFIPLITWPISLFFAEEFGNGLLITAVTPVTLASAAVWTRKAGGNDAVALMVTLITNLCCFFIAPFWLFLFLGKTETSISFSDLAIKLLLVVVLPMVLAQLLRQYRPFGNWSTQKKSELGMCAQIGILSMVFLGMSQSGERLSAMPLNVDLVLVVLATVAVVTSIHSAAFWFGYWSAFRFGMSNDNAIAVGFSGSQKTLMVGLKLAVDLGFSIVPMVLFHICQLIVDTLFATWLTRDEKEPV